MSAGSLLSSAAGDILGLVGDLQAVADMGHDQVPDRIEASVAWIEHWRDALPAGGALDGRTLPLGSLSVYQADRPGYRVLSVGGKVLSSIEVEPAEAAAGCTSCAEDVPDAPKGECPKSRQPCGHHCNCSWTQDACCWCDARLVENADGTTRWETSS